MRHYNLTKFLVTCSAFFVLALFPRRLFGHDAIGTVRIVVIPSATVIAVRDFEFAVISSGRSERITPSSKRSYVMDVSSAPFQAVSIILPKEIQARSMNGLNQKTLKINHFASFPSSNGVVSSEGKLQVKVGATRQGMRQINTHTAYRGEFKVELVY